MSVTTTTTEVEYTGTGAAPMPVPFPFFDEGDLEVTANGVPVGFSVTGNPRTASASVVLDAVLGSSQTILIRRAMDMLQPTTFGLQGTFSPKAHEAAFDRQVMLVQQVDAARAAYEAAIAAEVAAQLAAEAAARAAADAAIIASGQAPANVGIAPVIATGTSEVVTVADWMARITQRWYVDSVNGNDANAGTSPSAPLKTIAALLAKELLPGCEINLARGSKWRETIHGLPYGSVVRDYSGGNFIGGGKRPILDCSDVAVNGAFSKTGGRTNVYQIAWTMDPASETLANMKHRVWVNGTRLTRVADVATCDSTPGSFYAPNPTTGPDTVYVHSTGSTNPISDGKTYELAKRPWGVYGGQYDVRAVRIEGLHTRRNSSQAGSLVAGGYVRDCVGEDGVQHNIWNNGLTEDCVAVGWEPPAGVGGFTAFVSFVGDALSDGARFVRCRAICDHIDGVAGGSSAGFLWHSIGNDLDIRRMTLKECSVYGVRSGYVGSEADEVVLRDCNFDGGLCTGTIQAITTYTPAKKVLILGGTYVGANPGGIFGIRCDSTSTPTIKVRGARFITPSGGYCAFVRAACNVEVTRCTFYGLVNYTLQFGVGANVVFKNNVVAGVNPGVYLEATVGTVAMDYNLYFTSTGWTSGQPVVTDGATPYTTLAAWQASGRAQDSHSVNVDPQFSVSPRTGRCEMADASGAFAILAGADCLSEVANVADLDLYEIANVEGMS